MAKLDIVYPRSERLPWLKFQDVRSWANPFKALPRDRPAGDVKDGKLYGRVIGGGNAKVYNSPCGVWKGFAKGQECSERARGHVDVQAVTGVHHVALVIELPGRRNGP